MSNLWKAFREIRRNSAQSQTQPPVPEPASNSAVRKPDDKGLSNLVEMQQALIVQMQKENYDLAQCLKEKDEILVEKERNIKILKETTMASEYDNFEVEYWRAVYCEQQEKFQALYFHACNLAEDRDAMIEVERKRKGIIKQQVLHIKHLNDRVASLVHEDNMEHLSRQQSITTYSISDTASVSSSKDSQDKNSLPELAMDARRRKESHGISRMLNTVDTLARHYSPPDRYHNSSIANEPPPRLVTDPERLPDCVPHEMFALWLHQEDLTPEEEVQYDKYLQQKLRPPPIHSPTLKKPWVNWTKLNPFQHRNLPQPSPFPIQGCSPDPEFYLKTETLNDRFYTKVVMWGRDDNKCPFGYLHGFSTNMGTVPVPDQVIHGYRCDPGSGSWRIDAKG